MIGQEGDAKIVTSIVLKIMPKSFTVEQAYFFESPFDQVFEALTDPKVLVKWFLSKAKVVPNKGGKYTFDWIGGYHMSGTVEQFERNKAVSYSWSDKLKNGKTAKTKASFKVTKKEHGTLLLLRHTGFEDPEHFAECSSRWGYYLTNMKSVLDHGTDLRSKYDW
jgi:uncharacterized protein YndB with AHSA1/START domain